MRILPDNYIPPSSVIVKKQNNEASRTLSISGVSLGKDFFSFSKTGLSLGNLNSKNNISIWDSRVTGADDDESLKLMDESISEVGNILERMRDLTKLAEDEELTDLDRIDLQINMQRLHNRLEVATKRMSMVMAGYSEAEISAEYSNDFIQNNGIDRLLRAKERILNGEEWDVAEALEAQYIVTEAHVQTADGLRVYKPGDDGKIEFSSIFDKNVSAKMLESVGSEYKPTDDPNLPKLSDILKQENVILLMDSESAKEGTKALDAELKDLLAMRQELCDLHAEETDPDDRLRAEAYMTESDIQEMLGQISQGKQEKSEKIQKERDDEITGGQLYEDPKNINIQDYQDASSGDRPQKIRTNVGIMQDTGDSLRLVAPEGKKGMFFARLERFFIDGIGSRLLPPSNMSDRLAKSASAPVTIKYLNI